MGGGAVGMVAALAAAKGSGALSVGVGVSAFTRGGSNCGFSEEDKNILFSTAYFIRMFR
jgi:hypothetical protein